MRTPFGSVRGRTVRGPYGEAEEYLGVPYAGIGGRFTAPGPPPGWTGTRDALAHGPACPQEPSGTAGLRTDERGCLHMNVWRPASGPGDAGPLPVMVWIHGGAHLYGHNANPVTRGARLAARYGVVVAAPNYRLGALGHLTLDHLLGPDYADASNAALLDLAAALRWVRRAAPAFGGDPGNVTVFGQSAGGANVAALMAMPAARGLFRRAIVESGSADRAQDPEYGRQRTADLLRLCGLTEPRAGELLALPVGRLVAAQQLLVRRRTRHRPGPGVVFQPTRDGRILPAVPVDAVAAGSSSDVDLVVGTNLNEASGYAPLDARGAEIRQDLPALLAPADFPHVHDLAGRLPGRLGRLLGRPAGAAETVEAYLAEQLYREPSNRLLDARRTARGRTYAYLFTWAAPHARERRGAHHGLEAPFVFQTQDLPGARAETGAAPPADLAAALGAYWTGFARTGVPGGEGLPVWRPYTPPARATAVLDTPVRIADDPLCPLRELLERR
ncbi:carboxylesterase/lipase family protein [Streptomyces sp. NPDC021224]|uniref:carboxylesterase/lipase family protein n=1 Tax=unclassified Streptomyces TaxID=2593676 RepID=UPI0037920D89